MTVIERFISIIKQLRAPNGCPWDQAQTFESLTPHIIEEAYELESAMREAHHNQPDNLREELGDVLLHVVMLSNMAEEKKWFTFETVVTDITEKMIRRHPHVFGNTKADSVDAVWDNWEKIKKTEKNNKQQNHIFESIPKNLPALFKAKKIQKKAARQGFDWPTIAGTIDKVREEFDEVAHEINAPNPDPLSKEKQIEEFGDLLFALVNVARKLDIHPEEALQQANNKFMRRYTQMLDLAKKHNKDFESLPIEEKEALWKQIKN